jgi:hypothetical protein
LDTGTILWIVVWILFSSGRSSISWAEQWKAEAMETREAKINCSQNKTEADSAQEAEETDGLGKWGSSSEYSHGLN